jgi:hypothetical protein
MGHCSSVTGEERLVTTFSVILRVIFGKFSPICFRTGQEMEVMFQHWAV